MDCPSGNAYKVSVTGFSFSVIWQNNHSADWLAALASPYPAAPDFPLCRGQNKAPLCCELLMKGLLCRALLSHRSAGGRWWRQPPKGECISDARRAFVWFSPPKAAFILILAPPRAPTSPAGTVSQPIGKPFNGQAKGLLWLTWRSYAGPPQYI